MSFGKSLLKTFSTIGLIVTLGASMSACAAVSGGDSWKEEVLLHDGQKIIVERSQTYGGEREIGQLPPIKEHVVSFSLPGASKIITWVSEYGEELGRTNFNLLAVHALRGTPYVVASPNLCLSYNKWGRPNPPYVFFKYEGDRWQRISLEQFPAEFKTINVVLSIQKYQADQLSGTGFISAEKVKELNGNVAQPAHRAILREPYPGAAGSCGEMVRTGDGGWTGIGWFKKQPSREACLQYCAREKVDAQFCPCETLFGGN